jgi:hypothetical protein
MKKVETKLYIEEAKDSAECNVVIRIGTLSSKEDALNLASYIFITHALDFAPEIIHEKEPFGTIH